MGLIMSFAQHVDFNHTASPPDMNTEKRGATKSDGNELSQWFTHYVKRSSTCVALLIGILSILTPKIP